MIKFTDSGSMLPIGEDIGNKTGQTCTANCSAEVMCDKYGESHANEDNLPLKPYINISQTPLARDN